MNTDKIKARIQDLVPDIMELKFGCEVRDSQGVATLMRKYKKCGDGIYEGKNERGITVVTHFDEILGSPITLAVVLRAIYEANKDKKDEWGDKYRMEITDFGMFCGGITGAYYDWESEPKFWNLAKDRWEDQDEPTQLFIGSLLGV